MKNNKTYWLLGILIIFIVIAYFITSEHGEKSTTDQKFDKQFFQIDSSQVDKIELVQKGKKTTLVKSNFSWRLSEPVDYLAQLQFVGMLLSDLKNYKIDVRVSSNVESQNKYGFGDTNEVKLTVYQKGVMIGSMQIGNSALGPNQTYIKKTDDKDIFLAGGLLKNNFSRTDQQWRVLEIFALPKPQIKSVEYISDKEKFIVEKDTSNGKYFVGKDSVSSTIFEGILNLLANFNTQGFKDSTLGTDVKFSNIVKVDWGKKTEIDFYKVDTSADSKFYLKVSDNKQLFEVDKNFLTLILKSKKEILGIKEEK
jgi:hypothetical protein